MNCIAGRQRQVQEPKRELQKTYKFQIQEVCTQVRPFFRVLDLQDLLDRPMFENNLHTKNLNMPCKPELFRDTKITSLGTMTVGLEDILEIVCRALPQAGDGADIVEGWEARSNQRCFKCGKLGHWANSCPGLEAEQASLIPPSEAGKTSSSRTQCQMSSSTLACLSSIMNEEAFDASE